MIEAVEDRRFGVSPRWITAGLPERGQAGRTWESLLAGPGAVALLMDAGGESVASADLQTVALLESLRRDGRFPASVRRLDPERRRRLLARLVCDGILEVEREDGTFVTGLAAREVIFGEGRARAGATRLDPMAYRALLQVIRRRPRTELAMARRLYLANCVPLTARWTKFVDGAGGVRRLLGLERAGALSERYAARTAGGSQDPWLGWLRHGVADATTFRHKVYVSPVPRAAGEVFARAAGVAAAMDVPALKVAGTAGSLLRADKIVLHMRDEDQVRAVAAELDRVLAGADAQGVPFTTAIGDGGLLSWAVDPDERAGSGGATVARSWRIWIAFLLARALGEARDAAEDEQVGFALDRLRLEGVDPEGWRRSAGD